MTDGSDQVEGCLAGWRLGGEGGEVGPGGDEAVVGEGFGGPAFALAGVVQAIGEFTGGFGEAADSTKEGGRGLLATFLLCTDQVLGDLPYGEATVGDRVPVVGEFFAA